MDSKSFTWKSLLALLILLAMLVVIVAGTVVPALIIPIAIGLLAAMVLIP